MIPSPIRRLTWSLLRRCPNCGGGNLFRSYLQQRESCPACGLRLDRGERDFFIGAYTINLIVAELLVFFGGLAVLRLSWPDVPWNALMYGLAALMVIAPIVLYPFSRQVWLAMDLVLRPSEPDDFVQCTAVAECSPPMAPGPSRAFKRHDRNVCTRKDITPQV